eukprot:gnl/Dysnectes_brevis/1076_a1201_1793.p1 GENE.gnl/Dysnectes_brevis/1076_a1201_1793~~gnl/Dysnectes_brevis/1076_a1201_1793.p1  ORF type:complete len:277 (+),score=87.79 gnl/Dysnectes_brevis/1076_a1201_1793:193-1023(+)
MKRSKKTPGKKGKGGRKARPSSATKPSSKTQFKKKSQKEPLLQLEHPPLPYNTKHSIHYQAACRAEEGTKLNGSLHPCQILQHRISPTNTAVYEYYIHFHDFNKRYDDWYPAESLVPITHPPQAVSSPATPRHSQRRVEQKHQHLMALAKNIQRVVLGPYEMDAWYFSPYPDEFGRCAVIYVCPVCLRYLRSPRAYQRHLTKCVPRPPPGDEIYRDSTISVYELDGSVQKEYCRNLCLLTKLFLDHKVLSYDTDPFLFYVMVASATPLGAVCATMT